MRLYSPQTLALITLHLPKKEIHNNLFSYSCSVNEITFLTLRYIMPETLQISEVHHMQQFHSSAPSLHIAVVREVPGAVADDLSAPLPLPAAGTSASGNQHFCFICSRQFFVATGPHPASCAYS